MNAPFPPNLFSGRRFAVLGLGRNGLPAARALAAMGAEVTAWDDQEAVRTAARDSGIELRDPLAGDFVFDALVLSPGIPHTFPAPHPAALSAREAGVPILCDAELLFAAVRACGSHARFVGITGTNGKSTATALLEHILRESGQLAVAGGNLGPPALALPLRPDEGIYVLEMSSYMLERIASLRFDIAAMLNLSADHIERHGDMAGYVSAKRAIFAGQQANDVAVVGVDDSESRAMADWARTHPARVVTVSGSRSADLWCEAGILRDERGPILNMAEALALPGEHNAQNAAAAAAMAFALGATRAELAPGIASFPGLPHRQERIGTVDGVLFINDSKATNADAAGRALSCYERVVWIAGGIGKAGGIVPLAPLFPRIARALLVGQDAPVFAATLAAYRVPHEIVGTLEAAVPAALDAARATGASVILFSPAAASFDQFSGFETRGERFAQRVAGLARGEAA
ncbi:MAG: UDP-N-acetylmuramoyl-L-alanine--D-glutamate ligase [Acetobacteraceae bacterium]|nr:UDP-N-acetylmuramoyl-L-alanine--D-glutamate ligase [Acetobacteraceae bacterium]